MRRSRTSIKLDAIFTGGKRISGNGARLVYCQNRLDVNRFVVSPIRKYGTAVKRNRAKRICKEAFKDIRGRCKTGYDIVMVIYPGTDTFAERRAQLEALCIRAGIASRA